MDEESALARLPETYAAALRLRQKGLEEEAIAEQLDLEPQAVGPLLQLAEAKLAALRASRSRRGEDQRQTKEGRE